MKKQKKLDDGLNRLFSTPKKPVPLPPEEITSTPAESDSSPKIEDKTPKRKPKAQSQPSDAAEVRIPPKSHLIPVPQKPTLPLQVPDIGPFDDDLVSDDDLEVALELTQGSSGETLIQPDLAEEKEKSDEQKSTVPAVSQDNIVPPVDEKKPDVQTDAPSTTPTSVEKSQESAVKPTVDGSKKEKTEFADEQIVVFTLAKQYYGINIAVVDGIIKLQPITVVPRAPHFIIGVTNLRGNVVPVVSLQKRLDISESENTAESRIIIVNSRGIIAGMLVDEVNSVELVKGSEIEAVSQTISSVDSAYIRAIAKLGDRMVILLELDKVLQQQMGGARAQIR